MSLNIPNRKPYTWKAYGPDWAHYENQVTDRINSDIDAGIPLSGATLAVLVRAGYTGGRLSAEDAKLLHLSVDPGSNIPPLQGSSGSSFVASLRQTYPEYDADPNTNPGTDPGPATPPPSDQGSDEPYESEHTVSAAIKERYIKGGVYALENHRSGVNELLSDFPDFPAELRAELEASKAKAMKVYTDRLLRALDNVTTGGSDNPVGAWQSYMLGLGNAALADAQSAYATLKKAHAWIWAKYPQSLEGFRQYRNTKAYKTLWKARRSLHEGCSVAMLNSARRAEDNADDYQDFIDFRDQDEIRHAAVTGSGAGTGGFGAGGRRS